MPQKKVQPGVAYTKSGEKKISGFASTTPAPKRPSLAPKGPSMAQQAVKSRRAFEDQKKVDTIYRWK